MKSSNLNGSLATEPSGGTLGVRPRIGRAWFTQARDLTLTLIAKVPSGATPCFGHTVYFLDFDGGCFHDLGPCDSLYEKDDAVIAVLKAPLSLKCADGGAIPLAAGVWSISFPPKALALGRVGMSDLATCRDSVSSGSAINDERKQ